MRNVHPRITEEELRNHFADCGQIVSVNLIKDKNGILNSGIAYVRFETVEQMNAAIETKRKSKLKERHLKVAKSVEINKA